MKKLNVLITGGTGFLGQALIKKFIKNYNLTILTRKKENNDDNFIIGDLINSKTFENAIKKQDVVVHLAWSKELKENIIIMKNLIDSCENHNKRVKIILLSSMSAKRKYPDEYGRSKLAIENMLKESEINYTILRPSIIYGKGSTSFNFMIDYINKVPFITPIIGSGKYLIAPVYMDDVIEAISRSIDNKKTDKKEYDIPGKNKIYFVHLVNILKRELNINKQNFYVPLFLCKIIAVFFPKIITKENLKNLTEDSMADITPAEKDMGYSPVTLKEGIKNGFI